MSAPFHFKIALPVATLAACILGAFLTAVRADAATFQGAADHWGATKLAFTIENGVLSGFSAQSTGRVDCTTTTATNSTPVATDINPLDVAPQTEPAALTDGNFSVPTTGEDDYHHTLTVIAAGTVSPDLHRAEGTLTIDGEFDGFGKHWVCHDVQPFRALQTPATVSPDTNPDYDGNPVSFDLKAGKITKLDAMVNVQCPSTTVFEADFNSTSYRYDPIRVDGKGNFRVDASAMTGYGTVMDFSLVGRVTGDKAKGTISGTYENARNGDIEVCTGTTKWTAGAADPEPVAGDPFAYYAIGAFRFGSPGDYDYWFRIVLTGCSNANRVTVQVLGQGKAKSVPCKGAVNTEPLTPQRDYKIQITAQKTKVIKRNGKKIRKVLDKSSVTESIYLPGPDGNWQPIHPRLARVAGF